MSSQNPLQLFPSPNQSLLTHVNTTARIWPGVTPFSTSTLLRILDDNHERWHILFNDMGFHNHSAHIVLALWSLGAHESILEAAYKLSSAIQRPAFASPSELTEENWKDHLGNAQYYKAYMTFFESKIAELSILPVVEEYIFSANANTVRGNNGTIPGMAVRFIEGLIHPFIHVGYGFEFGMPGMVVEGLAMAAIHDAKSFSKIIPDNLFDTDTLQTMKTAPSQVADGSTHKKLHALSILARIQADARFAPAGDVDLLNVYGDPHEKFGDAIREYVDLWMNSEVGVEEKIEELVWMNVVIYGVGCYKGIRPVKANFFHMHLVTSSIFLSSLLGPLSELSQKILLRTYLTTSLAWYISVGRPSTNIAQFYAETTTNLTPPGPTPSPHASVIPSAQSPFSMTPNPWLSLLQTTLVHPSDHLVKLQRALSHYASIYGERNAGFLEMTELNGAEELDGTLFLRVAILSAESLGWVREGEEPKNFDDE